MTSEVFMICDAYESGMGHGLKKDGHSNEKLDLYGGPGSDKYNEAYVVGYKRGFSRKQDSELNGTREYSLLDEARMLSLFHEARQHSTSNPGYLRGIRAVLKAYPAL